MKGTSQMAPLGVRLPEDLKSWLRSKADQNARSVNSELVMMLQNSRRREEAATAAAKRKSAVSTGAGEP